MDKKPASSAVIFFVMDVSGSMTKTKKYLARSFFFLLYHFIRHKYEHIELVFVAHDTAPYEVDEEKFFNRGSSGGTLVSPALEYVYEQAMKRFHPNSWNIYTFHCSDGDNWPSDTDNAIEYSKRLRDLCQLYGYCEINPTDEKLRWLNRDDSLLAIYDGLCDDKFKAVEISDKESVWPAFKHFFGGLS